MNKLVAPYSKRGLTLKNHLVMSLMTRSRAINNVPNELMAQYYAQRTGAGLIITKGTAPIPAALGYPRIPSIFSAEQVEGWKKVTMKPTTIWRRNWRKSRLPISTLGSYPLFSNERSTRFVRRLKGLLFSVMA